MLIDRGFKLVRPLAGGLEAWAEAGYPVAVELPPNELLSGDPECEDDRRGPPANAPGSGRLGVRNRGAIGSSCLNADVNAFDKLQIVRDRNSSYFGSKYKS